MPFLELSPGRRHIHEIREWVQDMIFCCVGWTKPTMTDKLRDFMRQYGYDDPVELLEINGNFLALDARDGRTHDLYGQVTGISQPNNSLDGIVEKTEFINSGLCQEFPRSVDQLPRKGRRTRLVVDMVTDAAYVREDTWPNEVDIPSKLLGHACDFADNIKMDLLMFPEPDDQGRWMYESLKFQLPDGVTLENCSGYKDLIGSTILYRPCQSGQSVEVKHTKGSGQSVPKKGSGSKPRK